MGKYTFEITHPCAQEMEEALQFYETEFSSGTADFLTAFDDTLHQILSMPRAGKLITAQDPKKPGLIERHSYQAFHSLLPSKDRLGSLPTSQP